MTEFIGSGYRMLIEPYLSASLISLVFKSTLILILAGLVLSLLRRSNSVVRSYVLSLTFVIVLALPLLTLITPTWRLPEANVFSSAIDTAATVVSNSGIRPAESTSGNDLSLTVSSILIILWIAGTVIILIRLLLGWFLMRGILKRSTTTENHNISSFANKLATRMKLTNR